MLKVFRIDICEEHAVGSSRRSSDQLSLRIDAKTHTIKVLRCLAPAPVYAHDIDAGGNGITRQQRLPDMLRFKGAGSWGKDNIGAFQPEDLYTFLVEVIPGDLYPDSALRCLEDRESLVTGREIEFFLPERYIGNMKFPVCTDRFIAIENDRSIKLLLS